jgi:hypothetical protein
MMKAAVAALGGGTDAGDYVRANVRYRPDPNQVEYVQTAAVTLAMQTPPGVTVHQASTIDLFPSVDQ